MSELRLPLGKECTKCGEWKLFSEFYPRPDRPCGFRSKCKQCGSKLFRQYREEKLEMVLAKEREYRQENPEKIARSKRKYREEQRERYLHLERQARRKRYEASPDKVLERNAKWRKANSEKYRESQRRWEELNPERKRQTQRKYQHKRRAWLAEADGEYTIDEWGALCEQYAHLCLCCGEKKPLTVDHVVPISAGGGNDITNIQPLCALCNSRKGARTIDYR